MSSSGLVAFRQKFEISPIILRNGIAGENGTMPISTLLSQGSDPNESTEDSQPRFIPMPGATLIDQDIGNYPFADQRTAANAVIAKPLTISFRMIVPATPLGGYQRKLQMMQSLQASLQKHNASAGTYDLVTPSAMYPNCLMLVMRDISSPVGGETAQPQVDWQLDFVKPLLTQEDAQASQNALMSKLTSGTQVTNPAWSQPALNGPVGI
jgi:hypothetical protein